MGQQLAIINELPQPNRAMEAEAIFYDLMALALETESSRVMSLFLDRKGSWGATMSPTMGTIQQ